MFPGAATLPAVLSESSKETHSRERTQAGLTAQVTAIRGT